MVRRASVPLFALLLALGLAPACADDPAPTLRVRWRHATLAPAAPPGIGPERRVLIALRSGGGELLTADEQSGTVLEGPIAPVFATEHAPIAVGSTIVVASSIGRVVGYALTGEVRFSSEGAALGATSPLASAPDGSLRVGTTSGRLVGIDLRTGAILFDTPVSGAITSRPAVAPDGETFAASDTGRLVGVDPRGAPTLELSVPAPASGPSVSEGRVAVGALDGVWVFDRSGTEQFRRARAARVVGTRFLDDGDLLAWGEDGLVERLDPSGAVEFSYPAGPPIYADVQVLETGGFAVIDASGGAHRLGENGALVARLELGGTPLGETARGETGYVFVTVDREVVALDFE